MPRVPQNRARHGHRIDANVPLESPVFRRDRRPRYVLGNVRDPLAARPVQRQRLVQHDAVAVGDDRRRIARDGREGAEAEPQDERHNDRHPERSEGPGGEGGAKDAPRATRPPRSLANARDDTRPHG